MPRVMDRETLIVSYGPYRSAATQLQGRPFSGKTSVLYGLNAMDLAVCFVMTSPIYFASIQTLHARH